LWEKKKVGPLVLCFGIQQEKKKEKKETKKKKKKKNPRVFDENSSASKIKSRNGKRRGTKDWNFPSKKTHSKQRVGEADPGVSPWGKKGKKKKKH